MYKHYDRIAYRWRPVTNISIYAGDQRVYWTANPVKMNIIYYFLLDKDKDKLSYPGKVYFHDRDRDLLSLLMEALAV